MIDSADFALQARAVKPSAMDKHVLLGLEAKFEQSRGKTYRIPTLLPIQASSSTLDPTKRWEVHQMNR
jgi:hypothetical protein